MKKFTYQLVYFLKEAKKVFSTALLSNLFSILSTGLIFFLLTLVISGWWVTNQVIEVIQGEAQLNVYFQESLDEQKYTALISELSGIKGVKTVRDVTKEEAYQVMEGILGNEASVLTVFDENPFSAYIEVKIQLDQMDDIMTSVSQLHNIEYVRDNRDVLDRLKSISNILTLLGALIVIAVGISTLVITSHMIRQGIYNNREQIYTLKLLGAPNIFVAIPYLIEGLFVTLMGGVIAIGLTIFVLDQLYLRVVGPLPFIPLPSKTTLQEVVVIGMIGLSILLGLLGSWFGLSSTRQET